MVLFGFGKFGRTGCEMLARVGGVAADVAGVKVEKIVRSERARRWMVRRWDIVTGNGENGGIY